MSTRSPIIALPSLRTWLCSDPDPMAAALAHRYGGDAGDWTRLFSRLDPDATVACRFHYRHRREPDRIVGIELPGPLADRTDWRADTCRWQVFPHDPALPTLPALWASLEGARVVRYRPGHRCTFEVSAREGRCFVKVFSGNVGAGIHAASQLIHQASDAGELAFLTPRPLRWEPAQAALWQAALPGLPITLASLAQAGVSLAARLGAAAASLPRSGLRFPGDFTCMDQCARTQRYVDELARRLPTEAATLTSLMTMLRAAADSWSPRPLRAIHGALHLHQWLMDEARLGLVDLDRLCMGDPELDVATFITELGYEDRAMIPVESLQAAFRTAYAQQLGKLDPQRLAWYGVHKHLAKALKCVRGVRVDAERRAVRALTRARALAETCV
ncbi:MAG: phosphotransferase family protein [Gammaproteobacteria bacterium]